MADFDGDGVLTPVEFGYLTSSEVPVRNAGRKSDGLDSDGDGVLTLNELKKPETDPA